MVRSPEVGLRPGGLGGRGVNMAASGISSPVPCSVSVTGTELACEIVWIRPRGLCAPQERRREMPNRTWQCQAFPAPDGEATAVKFLNEPLRQGRGEASGTLRNDGTAGLLWLEPGSLGEGTEQTWQSAEFPAPNGEAAAVNFLNEPLRQGRGEASVTLRNDGTAGLLWLEPGSLGNSTAQTWQFA